MDNHADPIEHALMIIEKDGHKAYANVLRSFQTDLLRGAEFADRSDVEVYINISLNLLCGELYTWRKHVCNLSSFSHYHDPTTGFGLDLGPHANLEDWVDSAGFLAGLIFAPGFTVDVSSTPNLMFDRPYPSAADRCQEEYDLAVATWHGQQGYPWADAMFHLGWACHFLADLCVSPHTTSDRFWDHGTYEERITAVAAQPNAHLQSIGSLAQYATNTSARQLAIDAATETHAEMALYDNNQWDDAAFQAIPRSERFTARLLAKFLQDVGVANKPLPLKVRVVGEHPIPNAFVFFRHQGDAWRHIRTDASGVGYIALDADEVVELRPAMPGYKYAGDYDADAPTIAEFHPDASPVLYRHSPNPLQQATISFNVQRVVDPPDLEAMRWVGRALAASGRTTNLGALRLLSEVSPATDLGAAAAAEEVVFEAAEPPGHGLVSGGGAALSIAIQVCTSVAIPGRVIAQVADFDDVVQPLRRAWTAERVARARENPIPVIAPDRRSHALLHRLAESAPLDERGRRYIESPKLDVHQTVLGRTQVMVVPIAGEHRVTAQLDQGQGLVGYGCAAVPQLSGTTDVFGRAVVQVFTGQQLGLMRLRVAVEPIDPQADPGPPVNRTIEAVVRPDGGGPDPDNPVPPRLEFLAQPN